MRYIFVIYYRSFKETIINPVEANTFLTRKHSTRKEQVQWHPNPTRQGHTNKQDPTKQTPIHSKAHGENANKYEDDAGKEQ